MPNKRYSHQFSTPLEINLNPEETERKAEYLREIKDIYDDSGGDEFSEKILNDKGSLKKSTWIKQVMEKSIYICIVLSQSYFT